MFHISIHRNYTNKSYMTSLYSLVAGKNWKHVEKTPAHLKFFTNSKINKIKSKILKFETFTLTFCMYIFLQYFTLTCTLCINNCIKISPCNLDLILFIVISPCKNSTASQTRK